MAKLKVGISSFACDELYSIQILGTFNERFREWEKYFDTKRFRLLTQKKKIWDLDIAFVKGAI